MTLRSRVQSLLDQERLNFLLTNRIPRRRLTRFMGWFSRIEQPVIRDVSIWIWRFFSNVDLSEAATVEFRSLHDCFVRRLRPGRRPIDPDPKILVSPCDAIIGASGRIAGTRLYQVKGHRYALRDLLLDDGLVRRHHDGLYVTLRLTAGMYHRFHAPHDCRVDEVTYIPGDVWNVNPPSLKRIDKLYCRNERAVVCTTLANGSYAITLVPVAAVLVAGIHLSFLPGATRLRNNMATGLTSGAMLRKGEEMGWFEHGSTILVLAPRGFTMCKNIHEGQAIRVGQPLMQLPSGDVSEKDA